MSGSRRKQWLVDFVSDRRTRRSEAAQARRKQGADVVDGVEHSEGDANAPTFRRDANLVLREIVDPLRDWKRHHVDVRPLRALPWTNELDAKLIELRDQPIAQVQN